MTVAVTADIIGSRRLDDRGSAQKMLDETIVGVEHDFPLAVRGLRPVFADELQGEFASLEAAIAFTLLLQLALPDAIECRFGVGVGSVGIVASAGGDLPEGPAWWAAREAINLVHEKQQRAATSARTWVVAAPEQPASDHRSAHLANAYLLARDNLVVAMSERTRRLVYGRCVGKTQDQLGRAEGISQPAVSQALATAGAAAVIGGFHLLLPATESDQSG